MTNIKTPKTDKFVLVNVDFSAYAGQVALEKETLKDEIKTDIVTAGNLDTVPAESLRIFGTLRSRSRSLCLSKGTSFMGGYAIPLPAWPAIQLGLEHLVNEFNAEAIKFITNYEKLVQDQAARWPQNAEQIRTKAHSVSWVETRFNAEFSASFLSPAPGMDDAMNKQIDGMTASACNEIAADAKTALRAYKGGSRITRKMRGTLENMIDKLSSMSFINPEIRVIADTIQQFLDSLNIPLEGPLEIDEDKQSKIALILISMTQPENLPDLASVLSTGIEKIQSSALVGAQNKKDCSSATSTPHQTALVEEHTLFLF